jgi:beta-phosphoglucomutase-like phosphatase (HAD superfamily)
VAKTKSEMPAVLFDLDGTLIDSVYQHVQAWWNTLSQAGIQVPKWRIHRRVGMSGKSFIKELLREFAPSKKEINIDQLEKEHDARIREALSEIAPLRGADDLLKHLHRSNVSSVEKAQGPFWHACSHRRRRGESQAVTGYLCGCSEKSKSTAQRLHCGGR